MSPGPAINISPASPTPLNQPPKLTVLSYYASISIAPAKMPPRGAKAKSEDSSDSDSSSSESSDSSEEDTKQTAKHSESRRVSQNKHSRTDDDAEVNEDDDHVSGSKGHGAKARRASVASARGKRLSKASMVTGHGHGKDEDDVSEISEDDDRAGGSKGHGAKARRASVASVKGKHLSKVRGQGHGKDDHSHKDEGAVPEVSEDDDHARGSKGHGPKARRASVASMKGNRLNKVTIPRPGESTAFAAVVTMAQQQLPKTSSKVKQRASNMSAIADTGESPDDVLEDLPKAASKVQQRASTMSTASTSSRMPKRSSPSKIMEEIEEFEAMAKQSAMPNVPGPYPSDSVPPTTDGPLTEINEEEEAGTKTKDRTGEVTDSKDIKLDVASDEKAEKSPVEPSRGKKSGLLCCASKQQSDEEDNSSEQTNNGSKKTKKEPKAKKESKKDAQKDAGVALKEEKKESEDAIKESKIAKKGRKEKEEAKKGKKSKNAQKEGEDTKKESEEATKESEEFSKEESVEGKKESKESIKESD